MKVLVNGMGNVGTTLANLLLAFRDLLGISEVIVNKNRPQSWLEVDLDLLEARGATVCSSAPDGKHVPLGDGIGDVDFIFDCTSNGMGLRNIDQYKSLPGLIGACAQGSERDFGIPFMSGIGENAVRDARFVSIASCNTHAIVSVLRALAGKYLENLEKADFVMVRRSEDIGGHQGLVGASVIARHLDEKTGTHHGVDATELFAELGVSVDLTVSAATTPSQLMHCARFCIDLKKPVELDGLRESICKFDFLSITRRFDSNAIFELGRRYGFQGRIYSHAIVVANNLLVSGNAVKGWIFIPQEGNTMLSTLEAFLLQTGSANRRSILRELKDQLIRPEW